MNGTGRGVLQVELALCGFRCMYGLSDLYVQRARAVYWFIGTLDPRVRAFPFGSFATMGRSR